MFQEPQSSRIEQLMWYSGIPSGVSLLECSVCGVDRSDGDGPPKGPDGTLAHHRHPYIAFTLLLRPGWHSVTVHGKVQDGQRALSSRLVEVADDSTWAPTHNTYYELGKVRRKPWP